MLAIGKEKEKKFSYYTNIELFNEKLNPTTKIFGKPLAFCLLSDLYVKFRIIDNKSNDRMKYQDGLFLRIYRAIFVKGKILFPNSSSHLFVIRIPYDGIGLTKDMIIDDIEKNHKEYTFDYLMDPYKWFGKRHY